MPYQVLGKVLGLDDFVRLAGNLNVLDLEVVVSFANPVVEIDINWLFGLVSLV